MQQFYGYGVKFDWSFIHSTLLCILDIDLAATSQKLILCINVVVVVVAYVWPLFL